MAKDLFQIVYEWSKAATKKAGDWSRSVAPQLGEIRIKDFEAGFRQGYMRAYEDFKLHNMLKREE